MTVGGGKQQPEQRICYCTSTMTITDELAGIVKDLASVVGQQYKNQRDAQKETEAQIENLGQPIQDLTSVHSQVAASSSRLRLPTIVLPTFIGKLEQSINAKTLGFFLPVQRWEGCFPSPSVKLDSRHPRELKLTGLIAYIMFYKLRKFESSTITNDVIMTSFPKTMAKFGPPRNQTNYTSFERY